MSLRQQIESSKYGQKSADLSSVQDINFLKSANQQYCVVYAEHIQ